MPAGSGSVWRRSVDMLLRTGIAIRFRIGCGSNRVYGSMGYRFELMKRVCNTDITGNMRVGL